MDNLDEQPSNFSISNLIHDLLNSELNHKAVLTQAFNFMNHLSNEYESKVKHQFKILVDYSKEDIDSFLYQLLLLVGKRKDLEIPSTPIHKALILEQYAPQGLLAGCVLQNIANAANNHLDTICYAHQIHAYYQGSGCYQANQAMLFRQLLSINNLTFPPINSPNFTASKSIEFSSWMLPAYWLSLSVTPQTLQAEIFGAAFFELNYRLPTDFQAILSTEQACLVKDFNEKNRIARAMAVSASSATIKSLVQHSSDKMATLYGIVRGAVISMQLQQDWIQRIQYLIQSGHLSPYQKMVRLVKNKAKYAVGFHDKIKLGNQTFDQLILENPEKFVTELGCSRWVDRDNPHKSLLFSKLTAFGGPMFRVFSDEELLVLQEWVNDLAQNKGILDSVVLKTENLNTENKGSAWSNVDASLPQQDFNHRVSDKVSVREMYFRLLNLEQYPQVIDQALNFATNWLMRSRHKLQKGNNAIPFNDYSPDKLRSWFDAKAMAQVNSYVKVGEQEIDKTREEVRNEALQICPMILIDGAWLQRWGNAGMVDTPIGSLLYKIYSDEIGNGDIKLNHPNIYRDLMVQMGFQLHDFRSKDFAFDPQFLDIAFYVPVFWLAISLFPRRFMPETLGLNLAMELSGVGGAYRTARDELRHYGYSTLFVDLHNTIDNVSSGHSAMALQAIQIYLEQLDPQLVATHWQRIWTGVRALSRPKRLWRECLVKPHYITQKN